MIENCDLETKHDLLDNYAKELENENEDLYDKIKMYENVNNRADVSISNLLSKIGKQLPEEYRAKSRQSYTEILEKRRQDRIMRRNAKNK